MAKLGKKHFTKGKVMISVTAEGLCRPLQPFNAKVDKVDFMELVRKCEGASTKAAESLFAELQKYFLDKPAIAWTELPCFVDLAPTKKTKILKELACN